METCVRGFSFMAESKVDLVDLQYIEDSELQRAWKSTRRERLKQREQRIWDEFVKEKDVVRDVCSDDPYQFLDELPESCLKEIMDTELDKMTKENAQDEVRELAQHGNGDSLNEDDNQHTCVVTFADDIDRDDCDMFHIFDDEQSGEDEVLNDSMSPNTVREKSAEGLFAGPQGNNMSPDRPSSAEKASSSKSSENVTNVIESSIYCAKVKDLRMKINEELIAMMTTLDRRDILCAEPDDIGRMIKRSAEFCSRFNRIYMYQLQRQMHDIKRNNSMSLPFAKHTQFQSQMVRIVSLHQNLLQSFQVFHKSVAATRLVRECAAALRVLLGGARDCSRLCAAVPPPRDFTASADLYNDELIPTCDKFDEFVSDYAIRSEEFLHNCENMQKNVAYAKKVAKNKVKKKSCAPWTKNIAKNNVIETDARLSMYSLETLRLNLNAKSSSSKDNQISSTVKMRSGWNTASSSNAKRGHVDKNTDQLKSQRSAAARARRPLMRDPHAGRPRAPRPPRDVDIRTMVEAVDPCASTHISRETSPHATPRRARAPPRRAPPPRPPRSPRSPRYPHSPRTPHTPHTPRSPGTPQLSAVRKSSPLPLPLPHTRLSQEIIKPKPQSPKSPNTLKPTISNIKSDLEMVECSQMMPVLKIQCAIKKDLNVDTDTQHGECSKVAPPPCCPLHSPKKLPFAFPSPVSRTREENVEKYGERSKMSNMAPDRCEVTRLLKQLCSGDASGRTERVTGAKNAQLLYISGGTPRQPSTPQLLRILEETIQKKVPKPLFQKPSSTRGPDRYRLTFNIADKTTDHLFQYRTKFVQHMLTSALYANSAVGKPWEMIGSVSEQIIDELLISCMKEMELRDILQELYKKETC